MIAQRVKDLETEVRTAREIFARLDEAHYGPTEDLLTHRMHINKKAACMLRSMPADQTVSSTDLIARSSP
jgi:DNA-binding ferritin-like protein